MTVPALRLQILACTGGAGHLRAAEALRRTMPLTGLPAAAESADVLDYTTNVFKRLYSESYVHMVNRAPELWGYLYSFTERKPHTKQGLVRLFDQVNYRKYLAALRRLNPDALLCTHWLPYLSVAERLRASGVHAPVFAVTTDFDVHQLWIHPIVDRYFVFHEESAWQLASKGVPRNRITVSGIPVNPEFGRKEPPRQVRRKLGLPAGNTTLLVLSGGFGMGRVLEVAQAVVNAAGASARSLTVLVVCGRNEEARRTVASIEAPPKVTLRTFGFVTNIHELMDASDLLVTKSGGLTSSEALAKGVPMLIVDPIPGQEARNADLIVEHRAGWKAVNLANLEYKLGRLLAAPSRIQRASSAALRLGRPDAAEVILRTVVQSLQRKNV